MILKGRGEIGMPARQGRAVVDHVAGRPFHALFVNVAGDFVVGTQDVEVPSTNRFKHEVDDLLAGPGASRLFGCAGDARVGKAGDQQMRADARAGDVAQIMRQSLRKNLNR